MIEQSINSVQLILNSTDQEFESRKFFMDRFAEFGIAYNDWSLLSRYLNWKNNNSFGLLQIPSEFVDFAMFLSKKNIKTAVEVGVFRGASSYFLAAVLKRAQPEFVYDLIDIEDQLVEWEKFAAILPLRKHIPSTSFDHSRKEFDFVFIDGDHSYDGVLKDYLNLGRYARRCVAFHDIHGHEYDHLGGGTTRFWREFKESNSMEMAILEFSHSPTPWMGIGLGIRDFE